jgi:hypothetical protein
VDLNRGLRFGLRRPLVRGCAMAKVAHARACAHTRAPHQTPDAVCTRAHMRHCLPVCQGLSFMSMWVHIPLTRRSVCGDSEAAEEADHTVETWEAWNRPARLAHRRRPPVSVTVSR